MRARGPGNLAVVFGLTAVYAVAGKLALQLAIVNPSASAVWPPTGIALAALLVFGVRFWPAILVGAFLVNVTTAGNLATSLGIAAGNTLEAVTGALLVDRFANGCRAFERPLNYARFACLAGLVSTSISATLGVTSLCVGGFESWSRFGPVWSTWWLGDVGGALIVAPPLILWGSNPRPGWSREQAIEGVLLLLVLCLVGDLVFVGYLLPGFSRFPLGFLCVPPLLWAAFRYGPREAATAGALLLLIATWGTLHGLGPYSGFGPQSALLILQAFTVVSVLTAMSLAAVVQERSRAHGLLEQKAAELARSNTDLEQFAYFASHDLQEPLRMIGLNVQLLEREAQGRLGPEADECIRSALEGVTRMHRLISDLLAYSRLETRAGESQPADGDTVLREVLDDMKLSIGESGARVTVGPLPRIRADRPQLGQLFGNLIGNAIKFRGSETPRISVSSEPRNGEWVFSVRDNGIGFEMTYAEQIFEVFHRLHPRDRYPGTGIGLAICKKIVQRHGGRIWVESQPDRGSTFYFTLPVVEESGEGSSPADGEGARQDS